MDISSSIGRAAYEYERRMGVPPTRVLLNQNSVTKLKSDLWSHLDYPSDASGPIRVFGYILVVDDSLHDCEVLAA